MFFYTYVLKCGDGDLYVGSTVDLKRRTAEHQGSEVPATAYRCPLELIYYEACQSEEHARLRERALKTGYGRRYLKQRLGE